MKTLVIHPEDKSTEFLSTIYEGKDWTVINKHIGNRLMKKAIKEHDRLIVLGHGTEKGLYDPDTFDNIIDSNLVYLLREMENNIYIWCNADVFVKKYDLKGFYTGMIISEDEEANLFCVNASYLDVGISNIKFAESVAKHLDTNTELMMENVKNDYIDEDNNIITFNNENIYSR